MRLHILLDIEGFGAGCIFYDRLVMHGFECCSMGGAQEPPATPSPSSSSLNAAADASGAGKVSATTPTRPWFRCAGCWCLLMRLLLCFLCRSAGSGCVVVQLLGNHCSRRKPPCIGCSIKGKPISSV